jgi:AcrR family transcriptional regulator
MVENQDIIKKNGYTVKKHHKPAFEKISKDKREKILKNAVSEFARKGFEAANINIISQKAGISIGSMYNYFSSKEDLFLTIADYGYRVLEDVISEIDLVDGDIFDKIERLLRAAQKFSRNYPELNQIYLDITSEGLSHLSVMLSRKMETISAKFYRALLNESKEQGTLDPEIDEYVTAYCLDNLILLLQYSYTTDYFRERMKIFAGEDALVNDEKVICGMMRFIRKGLTK